MGGRHVCVNMWVGAERPLGHALLNRNGTSHDPRQTGSRSPPKRIPPASLFQTAGAHLPGVCVSNRGGGFKNIFGLTFSSVGRAGNHQIAYFFFRKSGIHKIKHFTSKKNDKGKIRENKKFAHKKIIYFLTNKECKLASNISRVCTLFVYTQSKDS